MSLTTDAPAPTTTPTVEVGRLPLVSFAVAFGLAGLAETWSAAAPRLGLTVWVPRAFWLVAAAAWTVLLVAHARRGARATQTLREQLRHPAQGPLAALVPVTAMLLGAELATVQRPAGAVVVVTAIVVAAAFGGWLVGGWLRGGVTVGLVHGGYLLPTVAAGLVGADAAAAAGLPALAWACFGVGCLFAVVVTAALVVRFAVGPPLPAPLVPSMSILMAPPAVAGLAWTELTGERSGPVVDALAGCAALLLATQLAGLPRYLRLPPGLGHWSFTFPTAAVAAFAASLLRDVDGPAATVTTAGLLAVVTALVVAVTIASSRHHPVAPTPTGGTP